MRAIVTGVTGQDGAYLSRHLLDMGYEVVGAMRRASSHNSWRLEELGVIDHPGFTLAGYDVTDLSASIRLIDQHEPDEVYNLAAQSFVAESFNQPVTTALVDAMGPLNILEAVRIVSKRIKFYQASTSEMFGKVQETPQDERTPLYPRSPYGVSKLFAHWMTINYRESYGMHCASGILFNHESPLRGIEFVTRKITDGLARVSLGKLSHIELGNLSAKRDWGYAGDYVDGMHRMLQAETPEEYVLATGRTETVRDFVTMTAKALGMDIEWTGTGTDEVGRVGGHVVVKVNEEFYRPAEVDLLIGDPSKARDNLGWEATTSLEDICRMMVEADVRRNSNL